MTHPILDDEEQEHSERGPSTAARWRACKASVLKSRGLPDVPTMYAAEGTVFHHYAAICLELGLPPHHFVGETLDVPPFGRLTFDKTMAQHMMPGLDFFGPLADAPGAKLIVEQKVPLDRWVGPGEKGTMDIAILNRSRRQIVTGDWKYGAGVPVHPEWNDQGILYTCGAWDKWGEAMFEGIDPSEIEVLIVIEQPRAPGGGGVWETTMDVILREGAAIRRDAEETLIPGAPFNPGHKQCQFCKAARFNTCEARAQFIVERLHNRFDELDADFIGGQAMTFPKAISPEARSQLLAHRKLIENWLDQLHEEAMEDAEQGRPVPGFKRVLGRAPHRKWRDEKKAAQVLVSRLNEDAYQRKLLSPAQVEELVGKRAYQKDYERHVSLGVPKPVLVPLEDKRIELANVHDLFDSIADDNP